MIINKIKKSKTKLSLVISFMFCSFNIFAAQTLSYSGRLVNTNGSPVAGPVNLRAELYYTNATSSLLCSDDITNVNLTKGVFNVKLDFDCGGTPLIQILSQTPNGESVAIKIIDVTNSKSYSFQAIHSVPFASVAQQLGSLGASSGEMLKWNGVTWAPGTIDPGGTVTNITGSSPISVATGSSTPVISISKANSTTDGYLSSTDWNTFNNKQTSILAGTTSQYFRGDKSWQTLDTSAVTENASHLYFTNARVLGLALTGFSPSATAIVATDTIVQAVGKTQGQINSLITAGNNYLLKNSSDTISGAISLTSVITATSTGDIVVNATPLTNHSAVAKNYVDTSMGLLLPKSGGVMTGILTLEDDLKIKGGSNYVTIKANASSSEYTIVLPSSAGTAGYVLQTDGNGNLSWVNPSTTTAGSGTVTSASIVDGSIVDADINASANIAQSKISNLTTDLAAKVSTTLPDEKILIGNGSNVATAQSISGDALITNTGVLTLKNTGTAGTYTSVTTDAQGRVTGGTNPSVVGSISVTAPIKNTGTSTTPSLSMDPATTTANGYLTSSDWSIFNNKQAAITAASALNIGTFSNNLQDALVLKPSGTNAGDTGEIHFTELVGNGVNYVALKAPDNLGGNTTYTFPAADGNPGDVLTTSPTGTLSWTTLTATNVQTAILSAYTIGANAVVSATDSVALAFGKLQKQISDLSVSSVGGDLTGTLPNPTIAKLQGTTVTTSTLVNTDVLKYNGTSWVNSGVSAGDLSATGTANAGSFLAGDNTWKGFETSVIAAPLTSVSTSGVSSAIVGTDTISGAFNKFLFIQGDYLSKTTDQTINGTLAINSLTGNLKVPTPVALNDAVNKDYVDSFGQWAKGTSSSINYIAGNVGVGTATPGSQLDVNGTIRVSQICDRSGANCKSTSTSWGAVTPTVTPLADAINIAIDGSTGDVFTVTLAGNRTLSNPTNLVNGKIYTINVTQDATGGRTLAWGTNYIFDTTSSTVGSEAGKTSVYVFSTDGTNLYNIGKYLSIPPCSGATVSYSTAGPYQVVVPSGCSKAIVKAWGAGGGNTASYQGGAGGFSAGTFTVTSGETLTVQVGGAGGNSNTPANNPGPGNGGTQGGGRSAGGGGGGYGGGGGGSYGDYGGGGGRSAVYGANVASDTLLIAAGGGGGGAGNGGAGGGANGQNGGGSFGGRGATGATGGTGAGSSYVGAAGGSWGGGVPGQGGDTSGNNLLGGTGGGLWGIRGGNGTSNCAGVYSSNGAGGGAGGGFGSGGGSTAGCATTTGVAGAGPGGGASNCGTYCSGGGGSAGGGGGGNIGAAGGGGGYAGGGGGGNTGAGGGGSGYVFTVRSAMATTLEAGSNATVPQTGNPSYASPSAQPGKDGLVVITWQQ